MTSGGPLRATQAAEQDPPMGTGTVRQLDRHTNSRAVTITRRALLAAAAAAATALTLKGDTMASYASDDLTPLLAPPAPAGVGYRQGIIRAWNPATAENTVDVAGALVENLPILNSNESLLLAPGDVVGIITAGASWCILGRLTVPGTPAAASALNAIRTHASSAPLLESTTSTSFTDLATVGPQVTLRVGQSGRVLVMLTCLFDYNGNDTQSGGYVSYQISGATSRSPNEFNALKSVFNASDPSADTVSWIAGARMTATSLEEGLTPGEHTITAKYKAFTAAGCQFGDRLLVAIPL